MSDYIPEWTFHPILIGNIFASRFRSILFKCEIWLEEKYGKRYDLQSRYLPPWYEYPELDSNMRPTGNTVPKLMDFKYPMNWPPFVHSEGGMLRAQFALDYLWDIWYGHDFFYFGPSPEGFGPGKAMFARRACNLRDIDHKVIGFLETLSYFRDISDEVVVKESEHFVFEEYYFNSMYGKDALYGPIRACNHRANSGLVFKKTILQVPVYNGLNYWKIKIKMEQNPPYKPEKYFFRCIDVNGVVVASNSHTIDIRKHSQITINYTGICKAKKNATLQKKDQKPAPIQEFPLEKPEWNYPVRYAARGRLYFNETSEDNDYIDHVVDESELWKDGCPNITYPADYSYIDFPESEGEWEDEDEDDAEEMEEEEECISGPFSPGYNVKDSSK